MMVRTLALAAAVTLAACGSPAPEQTEPAPAPAEASASEANPVVASRDIARDFTALQVRSDTDASAFPTIARDLCGSRDFCKVAVWTEAETTARGFPMSDRELAAMAFQYSINRNTGFEQAMWNCERFPQTDPNACLN
jgi:hypothetical protein